MDSTLTLSIKGMHCDGCVRRVTNALSSLEGVRVDSVIVGAATVTVDPKRVSAEEVAAAVDRIGFTAHIER